MVPLSKHVKQLASLTLLFIYIIFYSKRKMSYIFIFFSFSLKGYHASSEMVRAILTAATLHEIEKCECLVHNYIHISLKFI